MVEFVQLTTECCWGQPSDPCQRGCLTSHACVMWGPRTLNADDDDDDAESFETLGCFELFRSHLICWMYNSFDASIPFLVHSCVYNFILSYSRFVSLLYF